MTGHDERSAAPKATLPADALPEYWPENPPPAPVRPVWLPWPIAVALAPLLWLLPKRFGPHFAAVRWPGAVAAHLIWMTYGLACLFNAYEEPMYSWAAVVAGKAAWQEEGLAADAPTFSQLVRTPLAVTVWGVADEVRSTTDLLVGIGVLAVAELSLVALAACLMPFIAAGEASWRLFGRCYRLALWASGSVLILGLALQAVEVCDRADVLDDSDVFAILVGFLYLAWVVWIWLRSGLRYGGAAAGPGWERRRPLCEACGYALTGLTRRDRCPECGSPVADSLPEGRQPSAYAAAGSMLGRAGGLLATIPAAMGGRGFFQRLSVLHQYASARRFAIWVCVLGGLSFSAVRALGWGLLFDIDWHPLVQGPCTGGALVVFVAEWVAVGIVLLALLGFAIVCGFRRRTARPGSDLVAKCYSGAWLVALATTAGLAWILLEWLEGVLPLPRLVRPWGIAGVETELVMAFVVLGGSLAVVGVLFWHRMSRAMRDTRFANG